MLPFTELGQGSQFKAFDMQDGRALKIPLTESETRHATKYRLNLPSKTLEEQARFEVRVQTLMNAKGRIPRMIGHAFNNPEEFLKLLGHPKVIASADFFPEDTPAKRWGPARFAYTQDKVEMIGALLPELSSRRALGEGDKRRVMQIIDEYIQLIYSLWEFGYSDYVFKIGDTGFTPEGNLIAVDLGEFSGDYDFMERALHERRWRNAINPKKSDFPQIPPQLHDYYISSMDNALSHAELKKRWRAKHACTQCSNKRDALIAGFISSKVTEIDNIDRW